MLIEIPKPYKLIYNIIYRKTKKSPAFKPNFSNTIDNIMR